MLAFFEFLFLPSAAFMVSKNHKNLTKKLPKIDKNGGLGWFRGLLGELLEALEPQDGPKLKKTRKSEPIDPPLGATWRPHFDLKVDKSHQKPQKVGARRASRKKLEFRLHPGRAKSASDR